MGFVKREILREKRIAEWSEGSAEEMFESRKRLSDGRVMIQSRVWPRLWVGCVMCCARLWSESKVQRRFVSGWLGSSKWKLKSPRSMCLPGRVLLWSRRRSKSEKNRELVSLFRELGGGR